MLCYAVKRVGHSTSLLAATLLALGQTLHSLHFDSPSPESLKHEQVEVDARSYKQHCALALPFSGIHGILMYPHAA